MVANISFIVISVECTNKCTLFYRLVYIYYNLAKKYIYIVSVYSRKILYPDGDFVGIPLSLLADTRARKLACEPYNVPVV
jgi:hypothetical protein